VDFAASGRKVGAMLWKTVRISAPLALCVGLCLSTPARAAAQDAAGPRVVTSSSTDLNRTILALTREMPSGGSYAVTSAANKVLQSSISLAPGGGLLVRPQVAQPSYCSGATYLVFVRALQHLQARGELQLSDATLQALLVTGQSDGVGLWGRWNANGPGTARLFHELKLGRNFLGWEAARPGDFLKVFWTREIGQKERGHSVVYLGTEVQNGVEMVRFWSSNKPDGYGEKAVPKSKVAHALFSRLEAPANINAAAALPRKDAYLASLLTTPSSLAEMQRQCGF
jgi:hypothetical protein